MLNIVVLSAHFLLLCSVLFCSVIVLGVVALNVILLKIVLSVIILRIIVLSVVMKSVNELNVVAPLYHCTCVQGLKLFTSVIYKCLY
jgi:hypothetical protein